MQTNIVSRKTPAMWAKPIVAMLAALLALLAFSGCGSHEFSIEGTWQSTGDQKWGLVSKGSVVNFDGKNCNLFSPMDTYSFQKNSNGTYKLTVTGLLGMGGSFIVTPDGNDNITMKQGDTTLTFVRAG